MSEENTTIMIIDKELERFFNDDQSPPNSPVLYCSLAEVDREKNDAETAVPKWLRSCWMRRRYSLI